MFKKLVASYIGLYMIFGIGLASAQDRVTFSDFHDLEPILSVNCTDGTIELNGKLIGQDKRLPKAMGCLDAK